MLQKIETDKTRSVSSLGHYEALQWIRWIPGIHDTNAKGIAPKPVKNNQIG